MFAVDRNPPQSLPRISLAKIDGIVSARLGTTRVAGNAQPAVFNRQIAMYLAKHVGGWSTTAIGRFYNGRDHSTVCYALKRVAALRDDDPEVDGLVASLATEIKTAVTEGTGRTDKPTAMSASAKDLLLNDAFLDALADRLANRIFASDLTKP
jgi:Bacterial dnaA protein helix-turn-helix